MTVHKDSLQFNFGLIISILYRAYGLNVIELTAFLMQLIDTCREGDGERSIINQKRLLMYFKSSTSFKNYSIEMFTWIAQIKALVSEEMAHRLTWGRFVSWNGGAGRNIACDMAQEICNRVSKDIVKGMGPNKTEKSMRRASKAAAGMHQIIQKVNEVTNVKPTSRVHTHKDSSEEEAMMLQDIRKLQPFKTKPGRYHQHFPDIRVSPTSTVNMKNLFEWLEKHKKQIGRGRTKT